MTGVLENPGMRTPRLPLFQQIKLVPMKVTGKCLPIREEILMLGGLLLVLMVLGPILVLKVMAILVRLGKILRCLVQEKIQIYHKVSGQELLSDQWCLLLGTLMDHRTLVMLCTLFMTCLIYFSFLCTNINEFFVLRTYASHVLLCAFCTYGTDERPSTLHPKPTNA
jgi:hypothetical protein